jgi:hypothetical protein
VLVPPENVCRAATVSGRLVFLMCRLVKALGQIVVKIQTSGKEKEDGLRIQQKLAASLPTAQAKMCEITRKSRALCAVAIFEQRRLQSSEVSFASPLIGVTVRICGNQIDAFSAGTGVSGVNGGRSLCHLVADS